MMLTSIIIDYIIRTGRLIVYKVLNYKCNGHGGGVRAKYQMLLMLAGLFIFSPSSSYAVGSSGFELGTNTARSLGRGNAVSADPGEPAAVVFNPAGLTSLEGNQVSMSTSLLTFSTEYNGANGGISEDSATLMSTVPSFFMSFSTPIKQLKVGAGVNAPFGLATHYSSTGNFRYTAHYNQIKTVAYNLSAAYEVQEWLSVGVGMTYLEASTKQVGKLNNTFFAGGFPLNDTDFELDVKGHGMGMNVGVQIKPAEKHFLGVFYRTQVRTKQKGEVSMDNIPAALGGAYNTGGPSYYTGANTNITFPGSLTLAYKYQINEKWDVETDFTWTRWSVFDRVDISFDNPSAILNAMTPVNEEFKNSFSFQLGSSYQIDDTWTASGGYFYYQRTANKATYSNAIPDSDRHGFCLGLQYNKPKYSVHLSYIGEFLPGINIDNNVGATNGAVVDGQYSSFANILSMDAVCKF